MFVALVGILIWKDKNEIELDKDANVTLHNFVKYRENVLKNKFACDVAHLLAFEKFNKNVLGYATTGNICSKNCAGIISDNLEVNIKKTAFTVGHELGHNLGMDHDSDDCKCKFKKCIMAGTSSSDSSMVWSSCSQKTTQDYEASQKYFCLK